MIRFLSLAGLALALAACGAVPSANVSRDWTDTIADLGLTAIYPMHEGVAVGDLWVSARPLASGDQSVRTFGRINATPSAPEEVALPSVTLSADDAADLGLGGSLARGLGLSGSRNDQISVALTGVTSREIDDSTAWALLAQACQPGGYLAVRQGAFDGSARSFGAYRNTRVPAYLTVVTNVYLATGVNYQVNDRRGGSLDASVGGVGTPTGTAGSGARAASALSGAAGLGATTRAGVDANASNTTGETLQQSFTSPLAFAYDGFAIRVVTPGALCRAIQTGQTADLARRGAVRLQ